MVQRKDNGHALVEQAFYACSPSAARALRRWTPLTLDFAPSYFGTVVEIIDTAPLDCHETTKHRHLTGFEPASMPLTQKSLQLALRNSWTRTCPQ